MVLVSTTPGNGRRRCLVVLANGANGADDSISIGDEWRWMHVCMCEHIPLFHGCLLHAKSVSTHHLHHLEDQANLTALALVGGECKMHSCHTLGAFSAHLHWLLLPFGGEYSYIDSSFSSESSTTLRHQSSAQQKALAESAWVAATAVADDDDNDVTHNWGRSIEVETENSLL